MKRCSAVLMLAWSWSLASACTGVPNRYVCVTLSDAALTGSTPRGSSQSGPDQGFYYLLDQGDGRGPRQGTSFLLTAAGSVLTFELVGPSSGWALHPFVIVGQNWPEGRCIDSSGNIVGCALGTTSGVTGPAPATVSGSIITFQPQTTETYYYQSTLDSRMGGEILYVGGAYNPT